VTNRQYMKIFYFQCKESMPMANSITILEEIKKLPLYQQEHLYYYLGEMLVLGSQVSQLTQEVKEFRFV
jgi:hypothetical protein